MSIFVDEGGRYILESEQNVFEVWDGFIAVYAGRFDPRRPLENLVAANDDGLAGVGTSRLEVTMAPGVTARASPLPFSEAYVNRLRGPGEGRPSACFVIDEVVCFDDAVDLSLSHQRVCITVSGTDFQGHTGRGRPTGHRSLDSGTFWFFDPANWELLVKVLDGCGVNGHIWVLLTATTNVGFTVEAVLQDAPVFHKVYSNEVGTPAQTVLDTRAFSCDVL